MKKLTWEEILEHVKEWPAHRARAREHASESLGILLSIMILGAVVAWLSTSGDAGERACIERYKYECSTSKDLSRYRVEIAIVYASIGFFIGAIIVFIRKYLELKNFVGPKYSSAADNVYLIQDAYFSALISGDKQEALIHGRSFYSSLRGANSADSSDESKIANDINAFLRSQ